jgi:hypothetical protein
MNDTSPEALDVQLACFAALSPQARLRTMAAATRRGREFALAASADFIPASPTWRRGFDTSLDVHHLRSMADSIGVRDLLERLLGHGPS